MFLLVNLVKNPDSIWSSATVRPKKEQLKGGKEIIIYKAESKALSEGTDSSFPKNNYQASKIVVKMSILKIQAEGKANIVCDTLRLIKGLIRRCK